MRTINVYFYNELPTQEAKAKAREWWINTERDNPAWFSEHFESMRKAIELVENGGDKQDMIFKSEELGLTGYCADALLADVLRLELTPTKDQIMKHYSDQWDKEIDERLQDQEHIEDAIITNEYEFLEDGTRY